MIHEARQVLEVAPEREELFARPVDRDCALDEDGLGSWIVAIPPATTKTEVEA